MADFHGLSTRPEADTIFDRSGLKIPLVQPELGCETQVDTPNTEYHS
jgi:hypothetical protein